MLCRMVRRVLALLLIVGLLPTGLLWAENWPNWRGPTNNGLCSETDLPVTWSRTENVAWRLPLPGPAGATPVVWEDRIFLTSVDGNELVLLAVGTDGKPLWRRKVGEGNQNVRGDEGNYASPSPVTDGRYVFSFMGSGDLACFDLAGNRQWHVNLQDRYGEFEIQFGMTSTPVVHEDRLYLQLIHGARRAPGHKAIVVALDKQTGEEVWKVRRESDAIDENKHSYASPVIYDDGRRTWLLTHGADYIIAHRLSDGGEVWRCGGLNPRSNYDRTERFVASPAAVPGLIVAPSAKRGPTIAIRPDKAQGDVTNKPARLWTFRATPDVPSPLIVDDLVYLCMQNGNLYCLDAATGKEIYYERTHRQRHRASPVYADGRIYLTARDGRVTVVKAGREFQILAQNDIEEPVSASPAISNGTIYLRSFDALWAIRKR